ncbi:hypothetical protein EYF80_011557 [Liparis tanakae]|uniref:Uncharacterized protein n=1 Tax=Liparis tanakae TaxID=230148 RepID=A0A4Z2IKQ4_9TELE|nr:hypothetical protein EYF80_011557 [Liparis tanakae]
MEEEELWPQTPLASSWRDTALDEVCQQLVTNVDSPSGVGGDQNRANRKEIQSGSRTGIFVQVSSYRRTRKGKDANLVDTTQAWQWLPSQLILAEEYDGRWQCARGRECIDLPKLVGSRGGEGQRGGTEGRDRGEERGGESGRCGAAVVAARGPSADRATSRERLMGDSTAGGRRRAQREEEEERKWDSTLRSQETLSLSFSCSQLLPVPETWAAAQTDGVEVCAVRDGCAGAHMLPAAAADPSPTHH